MKREEVLRMLSAERSSLRARFGMSGSVARDEVSDADVLVALDRPTGYFGLIALAEHLERLLRCKVDVGTVSSLKPRIRERVLGECIHVA